MLTTPKFELVQDRLGRSLAGQLRYWQTAGVSAPAMATMLIRETRVELTAQTVRRWLDSLENGEAA